jgi:ABC-type Na+ efflux pump permease subunit
MAIWTLARKELRLLLRDPKAAVILLGMPLIFILILGLSLGETFGQKPDDRLRVSLVDLDEGDSLAGVREAAAYFAWTPPSAGAISAVDPHALAAVAMVGASKREGDFLAGVREAAAYFAWTPPSAGVISAVDPHALAALALVRANKRVNFPGEPWSHVVRRDLEETAGIRVETISTREEAERLVKNGKRSAVLVFKPRFTERVAHCSFLAPQGGGINPFYRDGVKLDEIEAELLLDDTQRAAASIIEQVAQVSLLRVILPWMIGRAFEKLGEPGFIERLSEEVQLPIGRTMVPLKTFLRKPEHKQAVGLGVQAALRKQFPKYELTGKTWAALTRSDPKREGGSGPPSAKDVRFQVLVPSYTVTFAFFLVLTVGWLFVSERRQGTLKRLRAAPISRTEVLVGKMLPCFALSLFQGLFLLSAGRLFFGMRWGPDNWPWWEQAGWIGLVVFTTSLAAIGLAMLIAALSRTETQVAIYGTLLVLVLAGVSGCLMPRHLMPEQMRQISLMTPHAWALDAYAQLLLSATPNLSIVAQACAVLAGFGVGFTTIAWWVLRLD